VTTSTGRVSGAVGKRYWVLVMVIVILGLSLLFSFNFSSGQFRNDVWSTLISGVQISTLVVVVAILLLWVRSRDQ